ncbi:MAG: hypothetical protein NMK33_01795 [Candidatus Cardinium sp.]|uniref:hypothetical protein n=1 Tax=Cardinium endosymbiont of Dermatophagoides farinae TaxID=2597823 RepID=UPI0011840BC6|nr:hypothetical protein [Cardinium endosymbiont of Dermatophagoides farinae]TSJ81225.1 hypothetical protein FPG78_04480 [Cardinium endosymbiont of Dermatophagoides farinae]UWW97275.1 MAG: hypothetical protein NMK33_01795 [Candidatus Cardinium sp.]
MKTTKNKIIKGIKTLSNAPLYCAIFVSAGWVGKGCKGQEGIKTIPDTQEDQSSICDPTDGRSNGLIGQDNPAYKHSSTDEGEDEHNNVDKNNNKLDDVDENNNKLDENNNVVKAPNNAEKVYTKQKERPNAPPKASEKANKTNKTLPSAKNDDTKSSDKPDQPKQNINKTPNTISKSPKKHEPDGKKVVDPNPKFNYQLSKNTKDEDIEKPKQYTLEDLNKLIPTLRNLYNKVKKIKNKNENTEKLLNNVKPFLKSVSDIQKDNQECICNAVKLVNGYITALKNEQIIPS